MVFLIAFIKKFKFTLMHKATSIKLHYNTTRPQIDGYQLPNFTMCQLLISISIAPKQILHRQPKLLD